MPDFLGILLTPPSHRHPPYVTSVPAHIVEPAGVARSAWPVTSGLPFASGELRDPSRIRVLRADGQPLPACAGIQATWPDGSIRWALLDLQTDLAAQSRLELQIDTEGDGATPATDLRSETRDDAIDVFTGVLAVRVSRSGPRLVRSASRGRREHLRPADEGADLLAWEEGSGAPYVGSVEGAEVEETNALRLCVRAHGSFQRDGQRLLGWIARLNFFAGHSHVRVQLTFVHDETTRPFVHLRRFLFHLPLALTPTGRRAHIGSFESGWELTPPVPADSGTIELTQWNLERHTITWGSGAKRRRLDRRTNALGWLQVGDADRAVTLKLRRPWQSYPKSWTYDGDRLGVELFPDLSGFRGPEVEAGRRWTEMDYAGGVAHDLPLRVPQGMARTHEVFLHFGTPTDDGRDVDRYALAVEMPLLLQLPSPRWGETGVFGPFPGFSDEHWPLELKLRRFCRPPNGRGILNDGDEVRLETLTDGRTVTRTTENLAYELPRSLLRQYLRAGDQRLFWEGEAAARHLMDVDTVHFSTEHPEWLGGPCFEWSQNHHFSNTDETELMGPRTSHTWLGSLLDYHFLTGCPRAREVAEMCADYCRRAAPYAWKEQLTREAVSQALEQRRWPFSTRVVGWALTGMGTFYDAFPEDRFLPAMESLVDMLEVWQDDDGRWRDQIGSHNRGATPFMISGVLQGLQLYYTATGDRRARRMLLKGATFLARQGRTREGIFFYKESPISDNPHASTVMCLPPLAWAYEETGDAELLDAGHRLFRWLVDEGGVATYMLKDLFAFMPLLERLGLLEAYSPTDARQAAMTDSKRQGD